MQCVVEILPGLACGHDQALEHCLPKKRRANPATQPREADQFMTVITLKQGEHIERALRRLKKILSREGTFDQMRRRRFFEKPSVKTRRKQKEAKFYAMLRQRHADD